MSYIRDRAAGTAAMLAVFGDDAILRHACHFESALAAAQAQEGLLTAAEAADIARACQSPPPVTAIAEDAAYAGTLAIALVHHLRTAAGASAAKLHLGATSQDVADTVLVLQAKAGVGLLDSDLAALSDSLAALAEEHAATPMKGRTLLRPARPVSFGLKAAQWLLGLAAARARLVREADAALTLQLGGAAGTGLGSKSEAVAARLAALLDLPCPVLPWHARRDGIAGLASALAIVTGALGKIARDISLLAQAEIGEAAEPLQDGRGGSSAMAHKRNATGCQVALSAALRAPGLAATVIAAMPQEHERGLGGWQAEAPVIADLFILTQGASAALRPVLAGLEVRTDVMADNLRKAAIGTDMGEAEAMTRRALDYIRKNR